MSEVPEAIDEPETPQSEVNVKEEQPSNSEELNDGSSSATEVPKVPSIDEGADSSAPVEEEATEELISLNVFEDSTLGFSNRIGSA